MYPWIKGILHAVAHKQNRQYKQQHCEFKLHSVLYVFCLLASWLLSIVYYKTTFKTSKPVN